MSAPATDPSALGTSSDPARWGESGAPRVTFRAPQAPDRTRAPTPPTPLRDARGAPLPGLLDRGMLLVLAGTVLLQALTWWRIGGYQIADSVEFMERARIFVRGQQMVDAGAIRPFGFSSLLVPFFVAADWLGVPDQRPVVWCMTLLQMFLGLTLVYVVVRLGALIQSRRMGLVAGCLVGTNPVFLQYSAQLTAGIAAGVCIAFALQSLLVRGNFRRALIGGLWLAGALLMAYQSLLISLALLGAVFLRDRFKHFRTTGGILLGLAVGALAQVTLDKLMFDSFGASLWNYVVLNFGAVATSFFVKLKLIWIAEPIYRSMQKALGSGYALPDSVGVRGLQGPWYYFQELPVMVVWPALVAGGLGLLRALVRPRWATTILVLVFAANVFAMSNKGSKDFRLWLPLLAFIAPLCASGWALVSERKDGTARGWQSALSLVFVGAVLVFSMRNLLALSTRQFDGYWRAMDFVNARVQASYAQRAAAPRVGNPELPPPRVRVGAAYNWGIYMRESPLVHLVKLPAQLNLWARYDSGVRSKDLEEIAELDYFITHLPILDDNPDLMAWVNLHFEVVGALYDQESYEDGLGPIHVLERKSGDPHAHTFYALHVGADPEHYRAQRQLPPTKHFARILPENGLRQMDLLGWQYHVLPPDGLGWITYHWYTPTGFDRNYKVIDRITSPDERHSWQNNHWPAYGALPTSTWPKHAIVSESYLVVPSEQPYLPGGRFLPLGGAYRRGDLIPVRLWIVLIEYDQAADLEGETKDLGRLQPCRADLAAQGGTPTQLDPPPELVLSYDGLIRVGTFFMPVLPRARLPDDGTPVPE